MTLQRPTSATTTTTPTTTTPTTTTTTTSAKASNSEVQPRTEWRIQYEALQLEQELGHGAFGVVYYATYRQRQVAVKVLKNASAQPLSDDEQRAFEREAELMKRMPPHPNVIRLVGVTIGDPCSIVTEFAENGALDHYLVKRRGRLSPSHRISMMTDACSGVLHLHENNLIHVRCCSLLLLLFFVEPALTSMMY
jgi:serine/threonine protein kinase